MRRRGLIAGLGLALVALAIPAGASAVLATLTDPADPGATASCPGTSTTPCTVVSRTTAMQEQVNDTRTPFKVASAGRLVGWEITLSSPTVSQVRYFDTHEGGTAEAAIAVIRQVKGLDYQLEYESPVVHLQRFFGHTATFALPSSVPVTPGEVIALTVPTWAPALELTAGAKSAWRASRGRTRCANVTTETAQTAPRAVAEYYCIYRTALIDYGAIEISTP
jgi:hypothetical protein